MKKNVLPQVKVIIVEDDNFYNRFLSLSIDNKLKELSLLYSFKYTLLSFYHFEDCKTNFDNDIDIVFTDYFLKNGYKATHAIDLVKDKNPRCKVVVLSQVRNMQTSVNTILDGAYDFIKKDLNTLPECHTLLKNVIGEKLSYKNQ